MTDCIFCKIVDRAIPANIVYEDEATIAFLDRAPIALGHTLVIPKKHVVNIFDVDEETLQAVTKTIHLVAPAIRDGVSSHGVHINSNHESAAGQDVFHLHFHIIPRHEKSDFTFWPKVAYVGNEALVVARKIREAL